MAKGCSPCAFFYVAVGTDVPREFYHLPHMQAVDMSVPKEFVFSMHVSVKEFLHDTFDVDFDSRFLTGVLGMGHVSLADIV